MLVKAYVLKVFGVDESSGNPAGVVLDADNLTDAEKKKIAKEIGFSETAFVQKSTKEDFKIVFFAQNGEIDFCGHATIAAWTMLFKQKIITAGEYTQETKIGVLKITILADGTIIMDQTPPAFKKEIDLKMIAQTLSIPAEWITDTNLKPQVVSTGLNDLMIPIDTREHLLALNPDDTRISDFEKQHTLDSFHVFTLEKIEKEAIANSRSFDPLHAIHEESATGSATGALACYLYKNNKLPKQLDNLSFEQGYSMKNPSKISVSLEVADEKITRVQVGGKANIVGEKEYETNN